MTAGYDRGLKVERLKYSLYPRPFTEVHIDMNDFCNRTRYLGDTSQTQKVWYTDGLTDRNRQLDKTHVYPLVNLGWGYKYVSKL